MHVFFYLLAVLNTILGVFYFMYALSTPGPWGSIGLSVHWSMTFALWFFGGVIERLNKIVKNTAQPIVAKAKPDEVDRPRTAAEDFDYLRK